MNIRSTVLSLLKAHLLYAIPCVDNLAEEKPDVIMPEFYTGFMNTGYTCLK
jgi:hypothetical protein